MLPMGCCANAAKGEAAPKFMEAEGDSEGAMLWKDWEYDSEGRRPPGGTMLLLMGGDRCSMGGGMPAAA